jgi:hypothetical protein
MTLFDSTSFRALIHASPEREESEKEKESNILLSMLRRITPSAVAFAARSQQSQKQVGSTLLVSAVRFGGGGGGHHGHDDHGESSHISEFTVDGDAKAFQHGRSKFVYGSSTKGEEVGARNEAAFIGYSHYQAQITSEPSVVFAMPHIINLLTVAPISIALTFIAAAAWGVAMWRFYAAQHFVSIVVERP